ncbi:hypothetical protein AVEN_116281-1 [Araneus ventricosus]|uniref:Uncharacterized protein n=1 Tax=Araneus ventricosus TaxID=182803 RepID=A0A4Y2VD21_ARAVE|nr:hypothetical protein AVEN_116281-1 [Araneus ventricosus]
MLVHAGAISQKHNKPHKLKSPGHKYFRQILDPTGPTEEVHMTDSFSLPLLEARTDPCVGWKEARKLRRGEKSSPCLKMVSSLKEKNSKRSCPSYLPVREIEG